MGYLGISFNVRLFAVHSLVSSLRSNKAEIFLGPGIQL